MGWFDRQLVHAAYDGDVKKVYALLSRTRFKPDVNRYNKKPLSKTRATALHGAFSHLSNPNTADTGIAIIKLLVKHDVIIPPKYPESKKVSRFHFTGKWRLDASGRYVDELYPQKKQRDAEYQSDTDAMKHNSNLYYGLSTLGEIYRTLYPQGFLDTSKEKPIIQLLRQAAIKFDYYHNARDELGIIYYMGHGVSQNYQTALRWFLSSTGHSLTRNHFHARIPYYLSLMYLQGHGVKQDHEKAYSHLSSAFFIRASHAASCGSDTHAISRYDFNVMLGNGYDVAKSDAEGITWLKHAAELGLKEAQYQLSLMYADGYGVEQCDKKAIVWHKRLASQGDIRAQHRLGLIHLQGRTTPTEGLSWFELASKQGLIEPQHHFLELMYARGRGVDQNDKAAASWFALAAKQNFKHAQYQLGLLCLQGRGVPQSDTDATFWLKQAAEQNHTEAQRVLEAMRTTGSAEAQLYLEEIYTTDLAAKTSATTDEPATSDLDLLAELPVGLTESDDELSTTKPAKKALPPPTPPEPEAITTSIETLALNPEPIPTPTTPPPIRELPSPPPLLKTPSIVVTTEAAIPEVPAIKPDDEPTELCPLMDDDSLTLQLLIEATQYHPDIKTTLCLMYMDGRLHPRSTDDILTLFQYITASTHTDTGMNAKQPDTPALIPTAPDTDTVPADAPADTGIDIHELSAKITAIAAAQTQLKTTGALYATTTDLTELEERVDKNTARLTTLPPAGDIAQRRELTWALMREYEELELARQEHFIQNNSDLKCYYLHFQNLFCAFYNGCMSALSDVVVANSPELPILLRALICALPGGSLLQRMTTTLTDRLYITQYVRPIVMSCAATQFTPMLMRLSRQCTLRSQQRIIDIKNPHTDDGSLLTRFLNKARRSIQQLQAMLDKRIEDDLVAQLALLDVLRLLDSIVANCRSMTCPSADAIKPFCEQALRELFSDHYDTTHPLPTILTASPTTSSPAPPPSDITANAALPAEIATILERVKRLESREADYTEDMFRKLVTQVQDLAQRTAHIRPPSRWHRDEAARELGLGDRLQMISDHPSDREYVTAVGHMSAENTERLDIITPLLLEMLETISQLKDTVDTTKYRTTHR